MLQAQPTAESHMRPQPDLADERLHALYAALARIPPGKVLSYGQLGELAGLPRAARWVGRSLGRLPADSRLPWHRVVGAGGRLSLPADQPSGAEQRRRLSAEGICLCGARLDIRRYGWLPDSLSS